MDMREFGSIEKGVMFGGDGYLFLLDGGHGVFDLVLGMHKVPDDSYANFASNILRRAAICQASNVKYSHVVYPDKQSVMTDNFPVRSPVCLGQLYLDRLPHIRSLVYYPRQILQDVAEGAFMRTDTHLTELANIVSAGGIVEQLTGDDQAANVDRLVRSYAWDEFEFSGDLGGRFDPKLSEVKKRQKKLWPHKWFHNGLTGGNNGIVDLLFSAQPVYDKRILVFGDSFSRELCSVLSYFFREVVFLRTAFFHDDIFYQTQPDFVVTSNVERYLSYCESDDRRPSFFMYPHINGLDYAPDQDFAEAFSAVLNHGKPPYLEFIRKYALTAPEEMPLRTGTIT
jgi:hypothetical protein